MQVNQATDYAFRAVLHLAQQPPGTVVEGKAIAQNKVIPIRYLLKIMPSLIKAGIIKSVRGSGGGYALVRSPAFITLLDIIEAIEGPIQLNRCLINPDYCSREAASYCHVHQALAGIQKNLILDLNSYTIAGLLTENERSGA
jgi:Rrf2 family protein